MKICLELNSISKGNKEPIYWGQYRSNQGVKFAEMALNYINGKTFHTGYPAKSCKAKFSINIRAPIRVEVIEGKKRLVWSVTHPSTHEFEVMVIIFVGSDSWGLFTWNKSL